MANHKSAQKRIKSDEKKRLQNRLEHKTARNAIKSLKEVKTKKKGISLLPNVFSLIDKLSKKNVIHSNKAANLKSKLNKFVSSL